MQKAAEITAVNLGGWPEWFVLVKENWWTRALRP